MKRLVLAVAFLTTPFVAWADCSGRSDQVTLTCMEGMTWDSGINACVPLVTG